MSKSHLNDEQVAKFWNSVRDKADDEKQTGYLTDTWPTDFAKQRFAGELRRVRAWIQDRVPSPLSCLDVGCGTGLWLSEFSSIFDRAVGLDLSQSMIDSARRFMKKSKISNVELHCCTAQELPEGELFDFIFIGGLLMYIDDDKLASVIDALQTRLRPGGFLLARESTARKETYYRDAPLGTGLFGDPNAEKQPYYAIYRTPALIENALSQSGLTVHSVEANFDYKLNDLKEDQMGFVNRLLGGQLREDSARAELWAKRLHSMRWLLSLPWYHFVRMTHLPVWRVENHWFLCSHTDKLSLPDSD